MTSGDKLAGKVAIITGAASGIGRATAILFLQHAARVLAVDLPDQSLAEQFRDYDHARWLEVDVAASDAPQRIVDAAVEQFGGIDILMNNAGIAVAAELSKAMAVDLGKYQITVNCLQPGAIVTGLSAPFFEDPEFRAYWERKAPVGRLGQPEDVAAAALFLASDEADFVSGLGFRVDGGARVNF